MQFQKNSRAGSSISIIKFLIKFFVVILLLFISVILVDKIDFPSPNKKIEKVIPNENFKVVK